MSRTIPASILASAASGSTTLARCWQVTRTDSTVYRWTEHDRSLTVDGDTYSPSDGVTATDVELSIDGAVSNVTALGALSSSAMTDSDIEAGIWDGASVTALWVDWGDPTKFWIDFVGTLGEIKRGEIGFEAEVFGAGELAVTPRGRSFGRLCDAVLGDSRCGKDVTTSTFRGVGTVVEAKTRTLVTVSGVGSFATGWFSLGEALWLTGANAGRSHEVRLFVTGTTAKLQLWTAPRVTPSVGDTIRLTAGCDKSFATCKARFDNAVNFRGFPHMRGDSAVLQTADGREPKDGSGRNVGRD